MGLLNQLESYWKFDEASAGNDAIDAHGSYDLDDVNNEADGQGGILNGARSLDYDVSGALFQSASVADFTPTSGCTIAGWFSPNGGYDAVTRRLLVGTTGAWGTVKITVYYNGSAVELQAVDPNGSTTLTTTVANVSAWHFIAIQWAASGSLVLYLDGVLQTTSASATAASGNSQVKFGEAYSEQLIAVDEWGFWSRVLAEFELVELYGSGTPPGYGSFTANANLTASVGTFTLTGKAAGLTATRRLTCAVGTFALTGQNASLIHGYTITAAKGTFTLTGKAASFLRGYAVQAAVGTFTLTGKAAILLATNNIIAAGVGTFTLTGNAVTLRYVMGQPRQIESSVSQVYQVSSSVSAVHQSDGVTSLVTTADGA